MSALPNRATRLDFRIPSEQKALIERAASIQGQTVTQFAIAALVRTSHEAIQQATLTQLTDHDRVRFLDMLSSDAEPNAALKLAAKRYRERRG
jgi:uncharacterized protein (DUF1778 family)